ncbi:excisionase [Pseudomonas savastanoi]|uniref:excisionase n=1 Tax=Pseudomonas savastanoi TaxID=29438 RepID=UPI0004E27416|nr:excisionase [Pseudomonas savastanoi]
MSKVTLDEWAADQFRTPPSLNTLRKWAREGRIAPAPVKHVRSYYVEAEAQYSEPEKPIVRITGGSLISRIESARNGSKAA